MIEINRDKRQSDQNLSDLETMKRNLEDNDNNNNNLWIDNGFNTSNKRLKTDSHSGQQSNSLSNTSLISTQDMTNVEMNDDEDLLNDGLDQFYSQMVDSMNTQSPVQTGLSSGSGDSNQTQQMLRFSHSSDQNMSSASTLNVVRSNEDIPMQSSTDSSEAEASEGRIKILALNKKSLEDELRKIRVDNIITNEKLKVAESRLTTDRKLFENNFSNQIKYERYKTDLQTQTLVSYHLYVQSVNPNAPILKTTSKLFKERTKNMTTSQINSQMNFNQMNYTPLPACWGSLDSQPIDPNIAINWTPSLNLHGVSPYSSQGEILVPESQSSINQQMLSLGSFPSQIPSTQFGSNVCSMSSVPQSMDISPISGDQNKESDGSESQSQKIDWNGIRTELSQKMGHFQNVLIQNMFFGHQISIFDDNWVNNTQEVDNWVKDLNDLALDMGLDMQLTAHF